MKVAIMQPYFLPYIGYYQLIAAADVFVVYDNIKYTKKGWINRNRLLRNGTDAVFSLDVKRASDSLAIVERELADSFNRAKLLNQFRGAYDKAPEFGPVMPLLERIINNPEQNLFRFIYTSIVESCRFIGIDTEIRVSSTIPVDPTLKGSQRVQAICRALSATTYINPIGGTDLYDPAEFAASETDLKFIKSQLIEYAQFSAPFVPWLSISDALMFNPVEVVRTWVNEAFALVPNSSRV